MKDLQAVSFEHDGNTYILSFSVPQGATGTLHGVLSSKTGHEISRMKYAVTGDMMAKWGLGQDEAVKFLSRFAKYYTQTRVAKNDLAAAGDYTFDADFGATKPEAIVEKVEQEWQNIRN